MKGKKVKISERTIGTESENSSNITGSIAAIMVALIIF